MTKKEFIERLANVPDDAEIVKVEFDFCDGDREVESEPYYNDISNQVFV